ncbi:hypothetical protein LUZ60_015848 [Juncus effusus]|nr:hypothetical protein LUZ60_015848 [Juncus effusus]
MKRLAVLLSILLWSALNSRTGSAADQCRNISSLTARPHSVTLTEFGAVGDGKVLNTLAFQNAIFYLKSFADKGGAQLYVPKGNWLTGSFNLTSHLTLFLEKGAVIVGSTDSSKWPIVEPLPSYGQGIDLPGSRHRSLINGYNVTDVVITGNDGVIDGQGPVWWDWYQSGKLNYSRPHLVEFVDSKQISVSNLTFLDSPAWAIHPVYCSDVQVQNITIKTSLDSPFTNGIVPDSSTNVCIENCAISVSNDPISLKSGWDNPGLSYNKPCSSIQISNNLLESSRTTGSGISFGSEMSGGISDVTISQTLIFNSSIGISFRTGPGRGGFIKNVLVSGVEMKNVNTSIELTGKCDDHPESGQYDLTKLPEIYGITLEGIVASEVGLAGVLEGIEGDAFGGICLSNFTAVVKEEKEKDGESYWVCENVSGFSELVNPDPCGDLKSLNSSVCLSVFEKYGHVEKYGSVEKYSSIAVE